MAAFVLYLAVFVITVGINVPLNDGIKAAGDPAGIADLAAVRERFNEARWVRWNLVRARATTVALVCLSWALVQFGRTVSPSARSVADEAGGADTFHHPHRRSDSMHGAHRPLTRGFEAALDFESKNRSAGIGGRR